MTDLRTSRLQLHAIDVPEAERIVARSAGPADAWAEDFPFEGDVGAVGGFLRATAALGEQRPAGVKGLDRVLEAGPGPSSSPLAKDLRPRITGQGSLAKDHWPRITDQGSLTKDH